jgi:hypothetical protein
LCEKGDRRKGEEKERDDNRNTCVIVCKNFAIPIKESKLFDQN